MSFGTELEKRKSLFGDSTSTFRKPKWFYPRPGKYRIRILDSDYLSKYTHWVPSSKGRGTNVECPGVDVCPICIDSQKIIQDYPDNYKEIAGFNPPRVTCYVNIFDRTMVKKCPVSGEENNMKPNGEWPVTSWGSGESLAEVEPEPSNSVKIFSRSKGVFETIETYDATIRESTEQAVNQYDLALVVKPRDGQIGSNIDIIPQTHLNDEIELNEEPFDLETAVIKLNPDEINELRAGVSLRDIFAGRRLDDVVETEEKETVPFGSPEISKQADSLASEAEDKARGYLEKFTK